MYKRDRCDRVTANKFPKKDRKHRVAIETKRATVQRLGYQQKTFFLGVGNDNVARPRSARVRTVVSHYRQQESYTAAAGLIVPPGRTGDRCHCVELCYR